MRGVYVLSLFLYLSSSLCWVLAAEALMPQEMHHLLSVTGTDYSVGS